MDCPKCDHPMEKVKYEDSEVDRCTYCAGIWFGLLEAEHLKELKGSESIDIGEKIDGQHFDENRKIDCPVCHTPMISMADRDQPHIHFESCTVCYGVYFDATEFTDYKTKTLFDFFRDLRARTGRD